MTYTLHQIEQTVSWKDMSRAELEVIRKFLSFQLGQVEEMIAEIKRLEGTD